MEHGKELKNNLDQAANMEDAKQIIAQAGKKLTDDEIGEVAGGYQGGTNDSDDYQSIIDYYESNIPCSYDAPNSWFLRQR